MKNSLITRSISASLGMLFAFVLVTSVASQTTPVINVNPATEYNFSEQHGNGMVGWTFNLQQTVTINQVGWYDDGQDGLSRAFKIGLWQDLSGASLDYGFQGTNPNSLVGDPVNGITIPFGTIASLNGSWRVVNLPVPLTLVPGNYELGGLDTAGTADPIHYLFENPGSPFPKVPGMTLGPFFYAGSPFTPTTNLGIAHEYYAAYGFEFGPMLFTNVPEPSSVALFFGAMSLLIFAKRSFEQI